MQIEKGSVVQIHYTLKDKEGNVIDSSIEKQPLAYLQGFGNLIAGLEAELEGKQKGDKLEVKIAPKDAYGEVNEGLIQDVPKSGFEGDDELQVGIQVEVQTENGSRIALVTDVKEDKVTLDMNHPLAGVDLHFNVDVVDVRKATEDELSHGHVNGPGGHHH